MSRWVLLPIALFVLDCGSFAARCGIWPGDRMSGFAEAPAAAFWKRATVTTSHEKGYAGGHGGGTTFHTMTVKLRLSGGKAEDQEFILEKGTLPLTSESAYIYGLVSRDYKLTFSPDGTKLAITYDGNDYGYVALDTKTRAILFYRERRFHPNPGAGFWTVFPSLEDYAQELLAGLQFTKAEKFRDPQNKDEPPYFRTIDSSSDDGVIEMTDKFLADYPHNEKIYGATLKGALEVSPQFPLTASRLDFLMRHFTEYPRTRDIVAYYLKNPAVAVNALAYAVSVLSSKPELPDLPLVTQGLTRFTLAIEKSDSNYRVYHTWDFNRYLWATAAIAGKLRPGSPELIAALQRVVKIDQEDMRYEIHPAQVYALQALASLRVKPVAISKSGETAEPPLPAEAWPKEYRDPHRDYCVWEEKYSDCKRFTLAAWYKATIARLK